MDNQHRYIEGYKELTQEEINTMNDIKRMANSLGNLIESLRDRKGVTIDECWLSIGKEDIQKGVMGVVRAITQPKSF